MSWAHYDTYIRKQEDKPPYGNANKNERKGKAVQQPTIILYSRQGGVQYRDHHCCHLLYGVDFDE